MPLRGSARGLGSFQGQNTPCLVLHKLFPSCRTVHLCQLLPHRSNLDGAPLDDAPAKKNPNSTRNHNLQTTPGSVKPFRTKPCCPRGLLPAQPSIPGVAPGGILNSTRHRRRSETINSCGWAGNRCVKSSTQAPARTTLFFPCVP